MAERIEALIDRDVVLVEGAGGVLVRFDAAGATVSDLALRLSAPALVVTRAGLGTLNHTTLTCEALCSRGVRCLGVVVGAWPTVPDLAAECNLEDLPRYTGVPILGCLPEGSGRLDAVGFAKTAMAALGEIAVAEADHAVR
jgi:dethiobiotin synthetase